MKKKTFQEIYDFCRKDNTYQMYHSLPDGLTEQESDRHTYLFGDVGKGVSRAGTYIYQQSYDQLKRFLNNIPEAYTFCFDFSTGKECHFTNKYSIPVHTHIEKEGVLIQFQLLPSGEYEKFVARSHRTYDPAGIIEEITLYCCKFLKSISEFK